MNAFPDEPCNADLPRARAEGTPAQENTACGDRRDPAPSTSSGQAASEAESPGWRGEAQPPHTPGESGPGFATTPTAQPVSETPRDPVWTGLDVLRLVFLGIVALFIGVFIVLFVAHFWIYPHTPMATLGRFPLLVVAGQVLAYVLLLAYMYVLVTRERRGPDFLAAIHWNWPRSFSLYLLTGVVLSLALQALAHLLPMPKNLPIDTFFRTPAEAWVITIFGITLAPLMEELFFRGFLYPVLARSIGLTAAVFITAFAFALLHGSQLLFSWGPVLVIFLVGTVLTMVRAYKNSVAAGFLIHVAYNGTISALMFAATDGFRHLEKLNQ